MPTAVVAAGGKVDPAWKLDGVDLMPYLTGKNTGRPHETLYWRFGEQWAIRKGDWKLVVSKFDKQQAAADQPGRRHRRGERPDRPRPRTMAKELTADWKKWNAEQMPPLWKPKN